MDEYQIVQYKTFPRVFFMSMPKPTRADLMYFLVKMLSPLELNNKKK